MAHRTSEVAVGLQPFRVFWRRLSCLRSIGLPRHRAGASDRIARLRYERRALVDRRHVRPSQTPAAAAIAVRTQMFDEPCRTPMSTPKPMGPMMKRTRGPGSRGPSRLAQAPSGSARGERGEMLSMANRTGNDARILPLMGRTGALSGIYSPTAARTAASSVLA